MREIQESQKVATLTLATLIVKRHGFLPIPLLNMPLAKTVTGS